MRTNSIKRHLLSVAAISLIILINVSCRPVFDNLVQDVIDQTLARINRFGEDPGEPIYVAEEFSNFESPQISPLDLTPDGTRLLAVNTPAARLEVLSIAEGTLQSAASIPVGLDPVSVRALSDDQAWVVNHVSDSISIVDLDQQVVVKTLQTADEPTDVVFNDHSAFVVCSQANQVLVFDLADLDAQPRTIDIAGEDPRAAVISPDGRYVYVAIFESGNLTTIVRHQDVSDPNGPYAGQNPPPNTLDGFEPPIATERPAPPGGLIVRKDLETGQWLDENGTDFSQFVTWDLLDHDIAVIDTETLEIAYIPHLMNLNMALGLMPDGRLSVVGTEAMNHIRFEPNLTSKFVRHHLALVDLSETVDTRVLDLNPHLLDLYDSGITTLPMADRKPSIADPRAIVWNAEGTVGYVAGLGSNNIVLIDSEGGRIAHLPVGEGPTGLALDDANARLFVLNRFESSVVEIDTAARTITQSLSLFDPTPAAITQGRKFLFDAHLTSGLGTTACAACHLDGRIDQLAWDLSVPNDPVKAFDQNCDDITEGDRRLNADCEDFHPIKGPMTTQTLQGIIGLEPLHWRGDRNGLADFNGAFTNLNGNDRRLNDEELQQLENYLASLRFAPNPFRDVDNTLPTELRGGNPQRGREFYLNTPVDTIHGRLDMLGSAVQGPVAEIGPVLACNRCHQLPTGSNQLITTAIDLNEPQGMKVPQLRNVYEKHGFDRLAANNTGSGFGFTHDGALATLEDFFALEVFDFTGDGSDGAQNVADVIAFVMAISTDTHAGVGAQVTLAGDTAISADAMALLSKMLFLADSNDVGLTVTGTLGGAPAAFAYEGQDRFAGLRSDIEADSAALQILNPGDYLTWTLVPLGAERRLSIDANNNGIPDGDE
jgi:DNA-binding beta-propeller fold protein YncE